VVHYRRALDEDEAQRLLAKSPPCYSRIWLLMLGTGFRLSEVQGLLWADVDLDRRQIVLPGDRQKNHTTSAQPLPGAVLDMLKALREATPEDQKHVFVNAAGRPWTVNLRRKLKSCCRAAGIVKDGVDLHSLRVTFVTHLVRAGVDIKTVQRLARHKTVAMTLDVYARSFPQDQRQAVERLPFFGHNMGTQSGVNAEKRKAG
jgi:integrase/recombinase XerC/integrase/recombinase XerD